MTKQRREQEEENRRRWRQALLWSLGVHVLVFGIGLNVPPWRESASNGPSVERLVAHLTRPPVVEPMPAKSIPPRPIPSRNVERAAARVAAAPLAAIPPAPTFVVPAVATEGAAVNTESAPIPAASVVPPTVGAGAGAMVLDADALGSYKLLLAAQARRFKRYPAQAQAAGWVGVAEVRLAIARGGRALPAELGKTSGHDALDRAALAMIDAAAQRAELPPALQGQAFAITLPVEFKLEDR